MDRRPKTARVGRRPAGRCWFLPSALAGLIAVLLLAPLPAVAEAWERDLTGLLRRLLRGALGMEGDELAHVVLFAALTWASCRELARNGRVAWMVGAATLVVGYGALIEWGQRALGLRAAEWSDFVADVLGVALGLVLAAVPLLYRQTKRAPGAG